jgi:hypothetical protein
MSQPIATMPLSQFDERCPPTAPVRFTLDPREWPALARWCPAFFKSLAPQQRVKVRVSKSGNFRYLADGTPVDPTEQHDIDDALLEQATDWITNEAPGAPKYYIAQFKFGNALPQLLADLGFPRSDRLHPPTLWFGSSETISQLHFDRGSNLYCQVYGGKQFTLFSPDDTRFLYPYPEDSLLAHVSEVDVGRPDLERYPLFRRAQPMLVTLQAGDILFLPGYWWHYVRSLSVSISVNQWCREELTDRCTPNAVALLRAEYRRWLQHPETAPRGRSLEGWLEGAEALLRRNASAAALALGCGVAEWSDATEGRLEDWISAPVFFEKWRHITDIAAPRDDAAADSEFAAEVAFCLDQIRRCVGPSAQEAVLPHKGGGDEQSIRE